MNRNRVVLILLVATVFLAMAYHQWIHRAREQGVTLQPPQGPSASDIGSTTIAAATSTQLAPSPDKLHEGAAMHRLDSALAELKAVASPSEARQILLELHTYLASLPPEVAAAVITDFLSDPAGDAATQIGFSVGKAGFLDGQPTLRVALLDWLGQIHPGQAGTVAEKILAAPTHPDEWAVCLRNYARANPESRELLRAKTQELIRNPAWREHPSVGFLEAFDVLVHTHATESSGLLGTLAADWTPEGKALAHAAYLTLDRLTIREPATMMEQLAAQPELIEVRGLMVANLFARADLRDPQQRQLVRDYLLDPARTPDELASFSGVYPNANFAISRNLLTETRTPTRDEIVAHDAAVLETVKAWLADPAFEPVKPYLTTMRDRLVTFAQQAARR